MKPKGGKPPSPRSFHKMIAINEVIFVFGGCPAKGRAADLHQFDTRTNIWTEVCRCLSVNRLLSSSY